MSSRRKRVRRHAQDAGNPGTLRLAIVIAALVGINLYVFLWRGGTSIPDVMEKAAIAGNEGALVEAEEKQKLAQAVKAEEVIGAAGKPLLRVEKGEVEAGDSMGAILRKHGLEADAADELIRALSGKLDFRKIRAGQTFKLTFNPAGRLMGFEFHVSPTVEVHARRSEEGVLEAQVLEATTEIRQESFGGEVEGSLYRSMKSQGADGSLVSFFVDVFAYDLNFYIDTHPGDTYRILVEKEYLDGEFLGFRNVLAAEYAGKAGTFRALHYQEPGSDKPRYFNEAGESLEKTFLKTPLKFARVSSQFNPRRMHPVLHVRRGHWGTDYAAPPGTPIWAAAPGTITFRGPKGGAGNCVVVKHDGGLQTVYMHMQGFRSGQRVGSRVNAKDVIGYVGSTGLATGPHLHFGVKKDGHYIDPQKMKMTRSKGIAKAQLPTFKNDTAPLLASLEAVRTDPVPANPFVVRL